MKFIATIAASLALACSLYGQTTLATTTLSQAVPDTSTTLFYVASIANAAVNQYAYVDQELVSITAIPRPGVLQVQRASGVHVQGGAPGSSAHASGATVYLGPGSYFTTFDRAGSCIATREIVLPIINTLNGNVWDCTGGQWQKTNQILSNVAANSVMQWPYNARCDGVTDDSNAINAALANKGYWYIPDGKTCKASNIAIGSDTELHLNPGAKLLGITSDVTHYLIKPTTSSSRVSLTCGAFATIDGNSSVKTTSQKALIFADSITDLTISGCTFHNTGSPDNTMGAVSIYNSTGTVAQFKSDSTIYGVPLRHDCNNSTKRFVYDGIRIDGSKDNGIFIANPGGSEGACNVEVKNFSITNITDYSAGTGAKGNGVVVYQADNVNVHDGYVGTARYSCVRVDLAADVFVSHVECDGSQETSFYAELGARRVHFDHLKIKNGVSGVNMTNVAQRPKDQLNSADNIDCVNMTAYCVATEHDNASHITAEGVPVGLFLGTSSTSHDNTINGLTCTHVDTAYPATFTCLATAKSINTGADYVFQGISKSASIAATIPVDIPSGPVISAITKANPALVTYSAGTQPVANSTYCIYQVAGMVEINGLCGVITNPTASNFNIGIDTTAFSTFSIPAGNSPLGKALGVYSSGTTPMWSASANLHIQALP